MQLNLNDHARRDYHRLKQEQRPTTEPDKALLQRWFRGQIIATAIFATAIGLVAVYSGMLLYHDFTRPSGNGFFRVIAIVMLLLFGGIAALLTWRLVTAYRLQHVNYKTVYSGSVTGYTDIHTPETGSRTRLQTYYVFLDGVPFEVDKNWLSQLKVGDAVEIECFETSRVADIKTLHDGKIAQSLRESEASKKSAAAKKWTLVKMILHFLGF